ncbi:hypothetical protein [Micromonospora sp. NBC_00858]|uniref:hypothetical protein n=1 Tax=Micromonospora sp. NBC_00858 TaxID=2975979 RepID=UPI003866AF53|nr:hypothetical protein OG990_32540 [Micromonospora sp. NBC_00858]
MIDWPRTRAALSWTVLAYTFVGLATAPLAAAPRPAHPVPCEEITGDPAWLVWVFRETVWLSLAFSLPLAAVVTAVFVWRTGLSSKGAAALGVGVGLVLAAATVGYSIAGATCGYNLERAHP